MLSPLSVSSTETAHQSWRTSQRGRSSSRSMLWMLMRALTEGSHTASCTKTPPCQHSVFTRTQVLKHAFTFNYTHLHIVSTFHFIPSGMGDSNIYLSPICTTDLSVNPPSITFFARSTLRCQPFVMSQRELMMNEELIPLPG